ncbi:MAG: ABC transporter ATP-binding protein [Myxococcota bacterium]
MTGSTMLVADAVTKEVRDGERRVLILDDVSLHLAAGERVALLGASGSGKSTLLHILGALDSEYSGRVELDGQPLASLGDAALATLRNRKLGFVFQSYNLLAHLGALENVMLPARFGGGRPDWRRGREVLEVVGLRDKAHRRPRALSGGERQRVAIARALYHRPRLVLCDEPTGNLDGKTAQEILALFTRLSDEGVALLIATHDAQIATAAHRVLRLDGGRLQ